MAYTTPRVLPRLLLLDDGTSAIRLENFKVTNGPDLYVYLATDRSASDIVNLGRLKGNIGNQNYPIPAGTDLARDNSVLIWCKAFSVPFGSAQSAYDCRHHNDNITIVIINPSIKLMFYKMTIVCM